MARAKKGMKKFHGLFALHFLNLFRTIRRDRQTLAIKIQISDKENGMIYFKKGELVHAECENIAGEEAFIKILEVRNGRYSIMEEKAADVISIERDIGSILTEYNKSKSRDSQMPQLTFPGMVTEEEPEADETGVWIPPKAPKHGLQEEAWIRDWGDKLDGFVWACVLKPDGGRVMGVDDDDVDTEELAEMMPAVSRLFPSRKKTGWRAVYFESNSDIIALVGLLEGYILAVKVAELKQGIDAFKGRLLLLVEALNETLEKA
ncbi:DUF4388 domain-containing protein [candidate division WOR-3 bacterium]|uniref:DUF4388 domain-containing protein n=1 Tax=candidate division WOR-3 bacterium TaxID=2052148 RepID=A0A9D5K9T3_UNCW3|nr:DUF4388 domain-containing protein [candidate division WOR-3 bacterium]MBD3364210.1 DUF4388 domain-containing protein [candidate division WOR-3 bacterium]